MSLATRCNACGTVFRVVQDQLKVSEGWVRCGRCNEVFNALEGLFDLERDTPPDWSTETPAPPMPALNREPESDDPRGVDAPEAASDLVDRIDAQLLGSRHSELGSTPSTRVVERDRLEFPDAQFDPESDIDSAMPTDRAPASQPVWGPVEEPTTGFAEPGFIQHAQRRARWQHPAARAGFAALALMLLATLMLQAGHHYRDVVSARWAAMKPALAAWCAVRACTIDVPRHIEDISVESTALTRAAGPDAFKLSVTLRNHGTTIGAQPSVDLSLTDAAGQLVARRVLSPQDFGAAPRPIQPGAELPLQLVLSAGSVRVAGYTVEIFYP